MALTYIGLHPDLGVPNYETQNISPENDETIQTQVTTTEPKRRGSMPSRPNLPEFHMPEYDEREVEKLAQKKAAPEVSRLRQVTQQALSHTYDNPNVAKMTMRQALAGYGAGLGNIMGNAQGAAASQYDRRFSATTQAALTNYQAQTNMAMQHYNNLFQDYMSGGQTSTTTITRPSE